MSVQCQYMNAFSDVHVSLSSREIRSAWPIMLSVTLGGVGAQRQRITAGSLKQAA